MAVARTGNPALRSSTFARAGVARPDEPAMTIAGTVSKTLVLLAVAVAAAVVVWRPALDDPDTVAPVVLGAAIAGLVVAIVTVFKQTYARVTAPLYAVLEGVVIGALSAWMEEEFSGITAQAVGATAGVLLTMLVVYRAGWIPVTDNFRMGVVAATGGIFLAYLGAFALELFGVETGLFTSSSLVSIGISVVVVIVAALNLVLDFDFIEQGAKEGAPQHMEWYGAFGLLVTLLWLYLEILRLLAKARSR
jgi:uncharacterized YccA/Bax inhibitor family protein